MAAHTPTQTLLALMGEVALLLWSVQLVTAGVTAAVGSRLRALAASGLATRWRSFLAGLTVTGVLQSSTASAMMIGSFAGAGLVALPAALAMMLGANVGTTLLVQVVSFDTGPAVPLLLVAGYVGMRRLHRVAAHESARAVFGLGLMLLALKLMQITMQPVEHSDLLRMLLTGLAGDPVVALLLAAALSFAAHSSLAAILVVMSLASAGAIGSETMIAMVLGCNLGTAINPLAQARSAGNVALRLPVGNIANRLIGCALGLLALPLLVRLASTSPLSAAQTAAALHLGFNVVMAALFLPLLPAIARLLTRWLPEPAPEQDPARSRYLDESVLTIPTIALSNATREALRMADVVDDMLKTSRAALEGDDPACVAAIHKADDVLDSLYDQIQLYVGAIAHEALSKDDERRLSALLALAINLEHIGDIIEKSLMQMAGKRIRDRRRLPAAALASIHDMHERLREHLRLAVTVFMSNDEVTARRLIREKETFRDLEREAIQDHLTEIRKGDREALVLSALRLDITRDLKRIESHIAATVHGLLELRGLLQPSRLLRAAE